MRLNSHQNQPLTHERASSPLLTPYQQLSRSVLSCFLWEKTFYEDGEDIASRILSLAEKCSLEEVRNLAVVSRNSFYLRHVPLLLLISLIKNGRGNSIVFNAIEEVIGRPDELTELLSLYWKDGKIPLSSQMKKGLARAFAKFSKYQLAKYNRDNPIKLKDVMFLVHPKPIIPEQEKIWKALADGTLESPDTWEVSLSAGSDKKETWERLLREGKLGYLALLRNLRNMIQVGVNEQLITTALVAEKGSSKVLPFRYVAAARAAPQFEPILDYVMMNKVKAKNPLEGRTAIIVDVSGSMNDKLSGKSDLTRMDAACALAALINCPSKRVFSFSDGLAEIAPRNGMALIDAIKHSQPHGGTRLGGAITTISPLDKWERMIVITDEQSSDRVVYPTNIKGYTINVAPYKNGIGYNGKWIKIDGFSERVIDFIYEYET